MHEIEIWVLVDEAGNYGLGGDAAQAVEFYTDQIGAIDGPTRMVRVKLSVPCPKPVEMTGVVPEEVQDGTLTLS